MRKNVFRRAGILRDFAAIRHAIPPKMFRLHSKYFSFPKLWKLNHYKMVGGSYLAKLPGSVEKWLYGEPGCRFDRSVSTCPLIDSSQNDSDPIHTKVETVFRTRISTRYYEFHIFLSVVAFLHE